MKGKSKLLYSALFVAFSSVALNAQITSPIYSAPSPEAASLGEYGAVPVSLYTGTPNISIPLGEVKAGGYTLPISVSYHLGSVKPKLLPGSMGLGWSLQAAGCITNRTDSGQNGFTKGTNSYAYDLNGNILSASSAFGADTLNVNAPRNGNQLSEAVYDANGNEAVNTQEGVTFITYNRLNLPERIVLSNGDTLRYKYSAGGVKLQERRAPAVQLPFRPHMPSAILIASAARNRPRQITTSVPAATSPSVFPAGPPRTRLRRNTIL